MFETTEWSLTTEDGKWIDLLVGGDPFKGVIDDAPAPAPAAVAVAVPAVVPEVLEEDQARRGFRQQGGLNR
jgi:hypothetical protein